MSILHRFRDIVRRGYIEPATFEWLVTAVNHGGGIRDKNLECRDANANCPTDFVMFQNFKH